MSAVIGKVNQTNIGFIVLFNINTISDANTAHKPQYELSIYMVFLKMIDTVINTNAYPKIFINHYKTTYLFLDVIFVSYHIIIIIIFFIFV